MAASCLTRTCRDSDVPSAGYDATDELTESVRQAHAARRPLCIRGGDTKSFLGRAACGDVLPTGRHRGIVNYDPAELVLTARSGTPLSEVERTLEAAGQRLPFEPPHFGTGATFGGMIAAGLAGPARVSVGPVRDYVLGCRVLTGDGRVLRFGGEVMKNVAGYDVARLMVGSLGILGVLLDVSVKVLPRAAAERTLTFECGQEDALDRLREWCLSTRAPAASCWTSGRLHVRFEGTSQTLDDLTRRLGGDTMYESAGFWTSVREQTHAFFRNGGRLWRLQVPTHSPLDERVPALVEWHGAQRWYADRADIDWRAVAADSGGHATLFRGARADDDVFATLSPGILRLHRSLKQTFDPGGILNPGRMYRDL
jgi:glycolate oxidase FAD binding subunit